MRSTPGPIVALWLLEKMLSGSDAETLIGDLVEQHTQGRSTWWFWRQTFAALMRGTERELRAHPFIALRALTMASALMWISFHAFNFGMWSVETLEGMGILYWRASPHTGSLLFRTGSFIQLGFLGWVIGRLHASHPLTAIVILVLSLLAFHLPEGLRLLSGALQHPRYSDYLLLWAVNTSLTSVSWIMGGLRSVGACERYPGLPHSRATS